ncbi:hypothetical protein [Methanobacterium ferruginis]|jgi:uncharacterized protein YeaO (DUF488 family)|uniref:hypothetical protein n=1 Tax=Methanobacterium ferruginis TaxID=710191 RepID=UPI002572511C|nr:hypothetical protein [Methanobacterium ferruginis]MCC7551433.1 hypothetical protein [Methanobacterium sp.]
MVKNIGSNQYPQRKSKFKRMLDQFSSKRSINKSQQLLWLRYSTKIGTTNWLSKDSERWNKFQDEFQDEFEEKIKLMDAIRHKKKENEPLNWVNTSKSTNF